eukprot:CAMPEP_0174855180 /NCGR_PEP_ID=MMETSP1114-20130205/32625_1 /TAXON_ID=312471 /ORGANISM="Neobodo designis, Strain CCAP 1951/1" /LENGTH=602 /DNA_ID=CAMNT_0016089907 /DNA_START=77 /DNA_END=1885 /DNA_ORIENTATION=+
MNILPTIVQETVGQCKRQGFIVSAALAQFFIKAQLLTAKKDAQNNVEVTPEHVEQLVNQAVRTLTLNDSAVLETYKLQASVTTAQQEQVNKLRTERVQHKAKTQRLMEEVWSKRDPNEVFGDITLYIMHESNTALLSDEVVQRETMAALETVFPRSLMDSFIGQKEADKIRQLEEMWRIVWGIRLFNFFSGKGGTGIPSLLEDLETLLQQLTGDALDLQDEIAAQAREYSAVLSCPSLEFPDGERIRLQDELHNRLQVKVYLRSLLSTVKALTDKVRSFEQTWKSQLDEAQTLLQGSDMSTVPKATIYPHFMSLAERWTALQGLHREAQDAGSLFKVIGSYRSSFTPTVRPSDIDQALAALAPERPPNHELTAGDLAQISGVEFMTDLPADKKSTRLEFNGFCVVSFVDDGVLVEAKTEEKTCPGYLLLAANSAFYGFSSERALKTFAKDPFKYLSQKLMDLVAANPVLIYLLGLHPYVPRELYLTGSRKSEAQKAVETGDGATQTGHIDSYKDTHYVWSEWELRRLALKVASLRNKRTKSTQTNLSHFRRENDAQVYLPKAAGTQTLLDAAVQPPRVARYIKGLRGTADSKIEVVEKTFLY